MHVYQLNIANTLISLFPVFTQSSESGLITKEHIVTHTHLNFGFQRALHFSTLAMQLFKP